MENQTHRHIHGLGTAASCLMWAAIIFFIAQCTIKERQAEEQTKQVRMQTLHQPYDQEKILRFHSRPTQEIAVALLQLSDIPCESGSLTIEMPLQSLKSRR
jgi:hypothetical protein